MKELEIVFTKSKKKFPILSWLIMLWTWKSYSHVAVKFNTSHIFDTDTYYQASEGLVNYMSEPQFKKKHEIICKEKLTISQELYWDIRKACHQEAGGPYGLFQNVGIVLVDILNLIGIKIDNPCKIGRNCSELIYTKVIIPMLGDLGYNPDTIKPHHVKKIIEQNLK